MSTKENKELMRKLFEEFNAAIGDAAKLGHWYEKRQRLKLIVILPADPETQTTDLPPERRLQ